MLDRPPLSTGPDALTPPLPLSISPRPSVPRKKIFFSLSFSSAPDEKGRGEKSPGERYEKHFSSPPPPPFFPPSLPLQTNQDLTSGFSSFDRRPDKQPILLLLLQKEREGKERKMTNSHTFAVCRLVRKEVGKMAKKVKGGIFLPNLYGILRYVGCPKKATCATQCHKTPFFPPRPTDPPNVNCIKSSPEVCMEKKLGGSEE